MEKAAISTLREKGLKKGTDLFSAAGSPFRAPAWKRLRRFPPYATSMRRRCERLRCRRVDNALLIHRSTDGNSALPRRTRDLATALLGAFDSG